MKNKLRYHNNWQDLYKSKLIGVEEAARLIQSNTRIFSAGWNADPEALLEAIAKRKDELENVEICTNDSLMKWEFDGPEFEGHITSNHWFVGSGPRKDVQEGRATYTVHHFGKQERDMNGLPIDYGVAMVSPPDKYGFMSFGTEVAYSRYLIENAKISIVQVNEKMPYVLGDSLVHISEVDYVFEANEPLKTIPVIPANEKSKAIAAHIAPLIEDGSTLQLGIGAIPNAVGSLLASKHDLGIHSEMITEGMMDLVIAGAVNNVRKTMHRFKSIGCFVGGSENLYNWLDNNPFVELYPAAYTNDPYIIAQQYKQVSINGSLSVDLSGQCCSESIGPKQYSGAGGQVDFILGAGLSPGGKSFVALNSTVKTKDGIISTITPGLPYGSFVTTSRNDVEHVVTEYGVARLRGKSLRQRATALIAIAHPDFRAELESEAKRLHFI